jgi:DNA processing protein
VSASPGAGASGSVAGRACDRCLERAWLLGRISGHLDRVRGEIEEVLMLASDELIAAVGGRRRAELRRRLRGFDASAARRREAAAGIELICHCDPAYPVRLAQLTSPPAVLHVAGGLNRFLELAAADPVAIVGARRTSSYGVEVARSLGRGLACAGVTVVSGMALGIDSAAHAGALSSGGPTIAVLPGAGDSPYPRARRALYRQLIASGAAVSELPAGVAVRRWMFPARNRIIAALATMTVVVEAGARSGALLTAAFARDLGRPLGAVPGRITAPQAVGPNGLLADGAHLVGGPQDVLDAVFGTGARVASTDDRPQLNAEQRALLGAIADGHDTAAALSSAGVAADAGLAALASLELAGYIRRGPGGRFAVVP